MTVSPLRIRRLAVVAVLAIAVVLSACSDDPVPTPEPTATPTTAPPATPTNTLTPTPTATPTPAPTATPTTAPPATPTNTPTPTPTATPTTAPPATPTNTSTPTPTATPTPAPTATPTTAPPATPTNTPTPTPTATPTPAPTPTAQLTAAEVYSLVSPSIPFIETPTGTGSGVLIEGGYVITNYHVVWPYEAVRVVFPDDKVLQNVPVVGGTPWQTWRCSAR